MSEKRRDNRNRILHEGEYQRADGRYRYRYIDENGQENNVYSWRLEKSDRMPKGKKPELSLREKERQIQADLFDHIVTKGGNYTVLELVEKYLSVKTGVRPNTSLKSSLAPDVPRTILTRTQVFTVSLRIGRQTRRSPSCPS